MIHNFESWFKSKTGVNEQMVIKVKSAGGSKKSSGGSSSGEATAKTTKTPKTKVDTAQVNAFFDNLPGVTNKEVGSWGQNSVSCIFPHSGTKYQIFVWADGFAIRETNKWQFINGSDTKKLKLNLKDYQNWAGSFTNAANVKVDFSNWEDFRNKVFNQQTDATASGFGADDSTRADQLVEEIVGDVDRLLKSDGFKGQFKHDISDDVEGAVKYIQTDWWPNVEGRKMKALKAEIEKLPPQDKGGSGNRERLQNTYDKLNFEVGNCWTNSEGNDRSEFGKGIINREWEFKFNYSGPDGPMSRTWYTDF